MKHSSAAGPGGTAVTEPDPGSGHAAVRSRRVNWFRGHATAVICVAAVLVVAVVFAVTRLSSTPRRPAALEPVRYLGVYERSVPASYAGINQFGQTIGKQPDLAAYYSSWGEPFAAAFAAAAAQHGAAPLVQINPAHVQLTAITAGRYDGYLRRFADAVRAYRHRVIIGFGHEPNGYWFSWGYSHATAPSFVAAWRHIVNVFRAQGASNVTWLWTINIIDTKGGIEPPATVVAGQFLRELGRHRRLLLQAVLDFRAAVRADHQGRARAHPRSGSHLRDRRGRRGPAHQDH